MRSGDDHDDALAPTDSDRSRHPSWVPPGLSVSMSALRLHARALFASFESERAGIVSDDYLSALTPTVQHTDPSELDETAPPGENIDVAMAVLELRVVGLWQRVDDGYRVDSTEAIRMAAEMNRAQRRPQSDPQ